MTTVSLLDYGAGNVRNAIRALGFDVRDDKAGAHETGVHHGRTHHG